VAKIFYFSGTGNSYRAAKRLSEKISNCQLQKITSGTINEFDHDDIIGIIFPVYYFGIPKVVENFLINSNFNSDCYIFVIVTRGIPFAGGVRNQLLNILRNKISYFQYITMGDNFNIDFWNSSSDETKELRNRQSDIIINKIAISISNKIFKRKYTLVDFLWFITKNFPRYGYKTYLNKVYNSDDCFSVSTETCIQCNKCVKYCPVDNIKFDKQVLWMHKNCQLCLACFHCCPVNAIQYNNGYLTTKGKNQYWNYL